MLKARTTKAILPMNGRGATPNRYRRGTLKYFMLRYFTLNLHDLIAVAAPWRLPGVRRIYISAHACIAPFEKAEGLITAVAFSLPLKL